MQVKPQEVSADKATTPRYDTIVICGATGNTVPKEVDGGEVVAWAMGHGLAAMDALEEFVDDLAAGNCNQPSHLTQAAASAINLMRRRNAIGWEADEPTRQQPADWKSAVADAVATARRVFGESNDDAMQAIYYVEGLLLANEPIEKQPELGEPFMYAQLHAGDVLDWTQDPNRAEAWEEEGYTVAKLYSTHPQRLQTEIPRDLPAAEAFERNDQRTLTSTLLISDSHFAVEITPELVASWSDAECEAVEDYCIAIHYAACEDDGVVIPPRPSVLGGAQ